MDQELVKMLASADGIFCHDTPQWVKVAIYFVVSVVATFELAIGGYVYINFF